MSNEKLVKLIRGGHTEYLEHLYTQNIGMIYSIIRKCGIHSRLDIEDALQNGYIGLHTAAVSYDFTTDVKFTTYAYKAVFHCIINSRCIGNAVYMPVNIYALWYKIDRERRRLLKENTDVTAAALSEACNISVEQINTISAAACGVLSLNVSIDNDSGKETEFGAVLPDEAVNIQEAAEKGELRRLCMKAVKTLPLFERKVIIYRYMKDMTISTTAAVMSCDECDIRRAEQRALRRLKSCKIQQMFAGYI